MILSDGDVVFQPRKVERSGLWDAVQGRVLIYIHKEQMIDAVVRRYPAARYVMIDDKVRILAAMKGDLGRAADDRISASGALRAWTLRRSQRYPRPDVTVERIGELLEFGLTDLLGGASTPK